MSEHVVSQSGLYPDRTSISIQGEYQYEKLKSSTSTRLMELLPGQLADQLECRLRTVDLQTKPNYEAVSYVWGTEDNKPTILCDGFPYGITQNLAAALQHFRNTESPRILWVDSICIDQSNIEERNQQVRTMHHVYLQATHVLIWLGEESESCSLSKVAEAVRKLASFRTDGFENAWNGYFEQSSLAPNKNDHVQAQLSEYERLRNMLGELCPEPEEWIAFEQCRQSPWFTRAWTFQESFHGGRKCIFHIGGIRFPSEMFEMACTVGDWANIVINRPPSRHDPESTVLRFQIFSPESESSFLTLANLLRVRRGAKCKCPSDLVYSVLSVASTCPKILPDYNKPFQTVFAQATTEVIATEHNLDIFQDVSQVFGPYELPSWVPDWRFSVPLSAIPARVFTPDRKQNFCATNASDLYYSTSNDERSLIVRGNIISRILATHSVDLNKYEEVVEFAADQLCKGTHWRKAMYDKKYTLYASLIRILCFDCDITDFRLGVDSSRWDADTWSSMRLLISEYHDGTRHGQERYNHFIRALNFSVRYLQLMVTDGKKVGVAPQLAQPGDMVVLLHGGKVPYIIRSFGEAYTFVGECFVDGIMYGEALDDPFLPPAQDFILV